MVCYAVLMVQVLSMHVVDHHNANACHRVNHSPYPTGMMTITECELVTIRKKQYSVTFNILKYN